MSEGWLTKESARAVFELLIRRSPSAEEISLFSKPNSVESFLHGVRLLPEYQYRIAHEFLICFEERLNQAPRLVFRHIPRVGGTLFRNLIECVAEMPVILMNEKKYENFYIHPKNFAERCIYPLISGHVSAKWDFHGYTNVAIFREPRSRFLSSYRYMQMYNSEKMKLDGIETVNDFIEHGLYSGLDTKTFFDKSDSVSGKENFFTIDLSDKLDHCVWAFDKSAQVELISNLFHLPYSHVGTLYESIKLPKAINSAQKGAEIASEKLSRTLLQRQVELESLTIEHLMKLGKLNRRNKAELDQDFSDTCTRLNFIVS